jgi:WD40 repeat protein
MKIKVFNSYLLAMMILLLLQTPLHATDTIMVPVRQFGYGPLNCMSLSPDGMNVLTGGDNKVRLWNATSGDARTKSKNSVAKRSLK